jgi:DNA helicase TIP49 (TBP-interacting protein)
LVDEAFLRRLRYKIETKDPTEDEFRTLFRTVCQKEELECSEDTIDYLIEEHYKKTGRSMRRCHPRDLLEIIEDYCVYKNEDLQVNRDLLDRAAETYFPDNVLQ